MRSVFVASLACWAQIIRGHEKPIGMDEVGKANIDVVLSENENVLLMFYTTWCGHCKTLLPEFGAADAETKAKDMPFKLALVNCEQQAELGEKYKIKGYPTVKYFKNGVEAGDMPLRKAQDILDWVSKRLLPPVAQVQSAQECLARSTQQNRFVLEHKGVNTELYGKFREFADLNRDDAQFCAIESDREGLKVIYPNNEERELTDLDDLSETMGREKIPLFNLISRETYGLYRDSKLPVVWLSDDGNNFDKAAEVILPLALENRDKMVFTFLNSTAYGDFAKNMLNVKSFPALVIEKDQAKYIFPNQFDPYDKKNVETFLMDFLNDKVAPTIKSEEIPDKHDLPFKTIVGDSFKGEVLENENDVVVVVTTPWSLGPSGIMTELKDLPEKGKDENMILTWGTFCNWKNDLPAGIQVESHPTILYFKKGNAVPTAFEGNRVADQIWEFVRREYASVGPVADEL